jgi:hypothetical protein
MPTAAWARKFVSEVNSERQIALQSSFNQQRQGARVGLVGAPEFARLLRTVVYLQGASFLK